MRTAEPRGAAGAKRSPAFRARGVFGTPLTPAARSDSPEERIPRAAPALPARPRCAALGARLRSLRRRRGRERGKGEKSGAARGDRRAPPAAVPGARRGRVRARRGGAAGGSARGGARNAGAPPPQVPRWGRAGAGPQSGDVPGGCRQDALPAGRHPRGRGAHRAAAQVQEAEQGEKVESKFVPSLFIEGLKRNLSLPLSSPSASSAPGGSGRTGAACFVSRCRPGRRCGGAGSVPAGWGTPAQGSGIAGCSHSQRSPSRAGCVRCCAERARARFFGMRTLRTAFGAPGTALTQRTALSPR